MKEQVSIDNNYGCVEPGTEITTRYELYALFPVSEISRLKRLDEHVKKEIIHYKTLLDAGYNNHITIPRLIEFLESLDK